MNCFDLISLNRIFLILLVIQIILEQHCSSATFSLGDYFNMIAFIAKGRHFWRKIFQGNDVGFAVYPHLFKDRYPPPYVPITQSFPRYPKNLDPEYLIPEYIEYKSFLRENYPQYLKETQEAQPIQESQQNLHGSHHHPNHQSATNPQQNPVSSHFQVVDSIGHEKTFNIQDPASGNYEQNQLRREYTDFISRTPKNKGMSSYLTYPGQKLRVGIVRVPKRKRYGELFK